MYRTRWWPWILGIQVVVAPVGVSLLIYLLIDAVPAVWREDTLPTLAFSFLLAVAGYVLFAWRLARVLDAFRLHLAAPTLWRIHLSSLFYYFFLPAGVGYDLSKGAKIAAQHPELRRRRVAGIVVTERLVGGAAIYLLLLAAGPFIAEPDGESLQQFMPDPWLWTAMLVAVAPAAAAVYLWGRRTATHEPSRLYAAVAISAAGHLLVATGIWWVAASLGIAINLAEVVAALAATLLLQLVPVNLLGVSLGEMAAASVYLALGLEQPEALLLVTVGYAHRLAAATIGGAVEGGAALVALRRTDWQARSDGP